MRGGKGEGKAEIKTINAATLGKRKGAGKQAQRKFVWLLRRRVLASRAKATQTVDQVACVRRPLWHAPAKPC